MSAPDENHADKVASMDRTDAAGLALTAARRKVLGGLSSDERRCYAVIVDLLRRGENVGVLRDAQTLALEYPVLVDLSIHSFAGNGRTVYAVVDPDDPSRLVRNRCFGYHPQMNSSEWVRKCVKLHAAAVEKKEEDLFSLPESPASPEGSLVP